METEKLVNETLTKLSIAFTENQKKEVISKMIQIIYGEVASFFYNEHKKTIIELLKNKPFKESKFEKGRNPHIKYKEGSIRLKNNGNGQYFKQIKINGKWIHYNKWRFEKITGISPSKNETVMFIDGNSENFRKKNLKLIKLHEKLCCVNLQK